MATRSARRVLLALALISFLGAAIYGRAGMSTLGLRALDRASAIAMGAVTAQQPPVVTVSAASFETTAIAPCSIAAAFGTHLATMTKEASGDADPNAPGIQLPTELGGTTVEVNGQRAGLFFVSPNQVNYLVPCNTQPGTASVKVQAGDGTISTGTMQVLTVAPAIFTANSDGKGVPAAVLLRVKANGQQMYESISQCSGSPVVCTTKPIDLGSDDRLFLILFLSGIGRAPDPNGDGNLNENVHLVIGGTEVVPAYAGPQGVFAGLDQMNVEIPPGLIGRGRVNLAIAGSGFAASNVCDVEIGAPKGSAPPVINGFSASSVLAGQKLTINGSGFSTNPADMLVRVGGVECRIEPQSSSSQLTCTAPFGARTGPITVRTSSGEGISASSLAVRTSISGVVETTNRQPLAGVSVKVAGTNIATKTSPEGTFLLPDVASGGTVVEIDGSTVAATPTFPKVSLRMIVAAGQDNQFMRPISLQQASGDGLVVGASLSAPTMLEVAAPANESEMGQPDQTDKATLQIPSGATFRFPDGATSGTLTLTTVESSRTPVNLPLGLFSSAIVQVTPFGATINPGAKLIFPNPDSLAANAQVKLYRLDQTPGSPTLGSFTEAGMATVSANGQTVETEANAVKETGYYFVANPQMTTTMIGRVLDGDGTTPVRLALVRARGQEAFTDGNGGFVLRYVPVKPANDQTSVEASFIRPNGRVDHTQRNGIAVVAEGITKVTPDLVLPVEGSNRPPVIVTLSSLIINARETLGFNFTAYDPDPGQTIVVTVSGAPFASVEKVADDDYALRLAPPAGSAGEYKLIIAATDNLGERASREVSLRVNNASIICGQTISGSFNSVAQKDTYNFSGKAGDVVDITAIGTSGFVCALTEVYGPTNTLVKRVDCNLPTGRFPLPADGTYTIVVSESGTNNVGGYDLNLQFADGRCGTSIGCGKTISKSVASIAQHDVYTFRAKAGDVVVITAIGTSGFVCALTEVYGPTGALIKQVNCNNTTGRLTLPTDGIYTICVYESGFNNVGGYDLNLQFADGRCGTAIECGQTKNGAFASITQYDVYTFNAKANDVVVVTAIGTSGFVCAVTEVYSPTGALLKQVNCNSSTGRLTLPTDGTYTVLIYEAGFNNVGGYDLNLQFADGRCGTAAECGKTKSKAVTSIAQHDVYTFGAKANDVVIITAIGTSGFVCTVAEVYTPAGSLLKQVNCNNTTDRLMLPADGIYTILVYESGFNNVGGYDLNLQFADGRCGTNIVYGQTNSGNFGSITQHDVFTFSGKANNTVAITAVGTSGFVCATAKLYDPTGAQVGKNNCNDSTGNLLLPKDGAYTILVYESGFNNIGGYDINLTCIGANCSPALTPSSPDQQADPKLNPRRGHRLRSSPQ